MLAELSQADPALDDATRRLINRLLHMPSETLRALAAENDPAALQAEDLLRRLFKLDPASGKDDGTNQEDKT